MDEALNSLQWNLPPCRVCLGNICRAEYKNPARQPFPPTLLSPQPPPSLYYSLLPLTVFHPPSAYPTMKISSSTSLLFATLAISSSSPCLAAPASDPPSSEPGMTSSPSSQHVAARRDSSAGRALRPSNMQQSIDMARAIGERYVS
jgi:hypothetical protein